LKLMETAKRAGSYCLASTHGTLIDLSIADELPRMQFDKLRVTGMGGTREVYQRTHPGVRAAMFDDLKTSLLDLVERKRSLGVARLRVTQVCIVIDQNHDGLLDCAKSVAEIQADNVLHKPVDHLHDSNLASLEMTLEHAKISRIQLGEANRFLKVHGIQLNIDHSLGAFRKQVNTTKLYQTIPCYHGWLPAQMWKDELI
jgi:hypothetical protein